MCIKPCALEKCSLLKAHSRERSSDWCCFSWDFPFNFFSFFTHPPSPLPLFPSLHSLSLFITLSLWPCPRSAGRQQQHLREPAPPPARYAGAQAVGGCCKAISARPPRPAMPVALSRVPLGRTGLPGSPGSWCGRDKRFQAYFQKAKCSHLPANCSHRHKYSAHRDLLLEEQFFFFHLSFWNQTVKWKKHLLHFYFASSDTMFFPVCIKNRCI